MSRSKDGSRDPSRGSVLYRAERNMYYTMDFPRPSSAQLQLAEAPRGWGRTYVALELLGEPTSSSVAVDPWAWRRTPSQPQPGPAEPLAYRKRAFVVSGSLRQPGGLMESWANDLSQFRLAGRYEPVTPRDDEDEPQKCWWAPVFERRPPTLLGEVPTLEGIITGVWNLGYTRSYHVAPIWAAYELETLQGARWSAADRRPLEHDLAFAGDTQLSAELAASLSEYGYSTYETQLVFEDLHAADRSVIDVLVGIMQRHGCHFDVLATTRSGSVDDPSLDVHRVVTTLLLDHESYADDLAESTRAHLIEASLPEVSAATRSVLAQRYHNPLLLRLVAGSRQLADLLSEGELTEETAELLPSTIDLAYRQRWSELPEAVRDGLALAALGTPAAISPVCTGTRWDPTTIATAWRALPELTATDEDRAQLLRSPELVGEWIAEPEDGLQMFRSSELYDLARELAHQRIPATLRRRYQRLLADQLDLADPSLSRQQRRVQGQLLTALASEGLTEWTPTAVGAADQLIEEAVESFDLPGLRFARTLIPTLPPASDPHRATRRRLLAAVAAGGTGQRQLAIHELRTLLPELTAVLGGEHPDTLSARQHLGAMYAEEHETVRAIDVLHELHRDRRRALGADHPHTVLTAAELGRLLAFAGRAHDAIEVLTQLIDARTGRGEPDHLDTFAARYLIAALRGELGEVEEAIALLDALDDDLAADHTSIHPQRLQVRTTALALIAATGDRMATDDAYSRYSASYPTLFRFTSQPTAPDELGRELTSPYDVGWRPFDQQAAAISLSAGVHVDSAPDGPSEFPQLAQVTAEKLRAVRRFDEHARRMSSGLDVLLLRNDLAVATLLAGDLSEPEPLLRDLIVELTRLVGGAHPATLIARCNLALTLTRTREWWRGLSALAEVHDVQLRTLPPTHPQVARTAHDLALLRLHEQREQDAGGATDLPFASTARLRVYPYTPLRPGLQLGLEPAPPPLEEETTAAADDEQDTPTQEGSDRYPPVSDEADWYP